MPTIKTSLAVFAFAAVFCGGVSHAQPTPCAGQSITSLFGGGCASSVGGAELTDHDYGYVRVRFAPPPSLQDVVRPRDFEGGFLRGLVQGRGRTSSAVVLLEIRASGGTLPAGADPNQGVPLAVLPLAAYEYDGSRNLSFSERQEFADRYLDANLLIARGMRISTSFRVIFAERSAESLLTSLRPIINMTAALSGGAFVVNNPVTQTLFNNLSQVNSMVATTGTEVRTENNVDLRFDANNRLEFQFQLSPRAANSPKGTLIVELLRRPSLFTEEVLTSGPGAGLPNYGVQRVSDADRIWVDGNVAPGVSPAEYAQQDDSLRRELEIFRSRETNEADFDRVCDALVQRLDTLGLSRHDRVAVFWAAFASGNSAHRPEIQNRPCIRDRREEWQRYQLVLPTTAPVAAPLPDAQSLQQWLNIAQLYLGEQNAATRMRNVLDLFARNVTVTIAPDTIYPSGVPVEPPGSIMSREALVRDMAAIQIGCRFQASENPPRFSVLARRAGASQALTLTMDYGGRVGGATNVEITGLTVRETTDADWAAVDAANDPRPQCRSSNREYAPLPAPG
ncbi:MAG: hypothetical protein AB7P07_02985 [Hyphomonadaceae bacterium]